MARQRRLLQIARRMVPFVSKGQGSSVVWEKKREQANKLIYRKHGIPNAVQLGHTLVAHSSLDRLTPGTQMTWPGLPTLTPVGVCRGEIIEVCSPGHLCRDVAVQMALAEARNGSVLWMAVGAQAVGYSSAVLGEIPNVTLQQRGILAAADSKATLQELLRRVRQQTYTMVVLDHVAGLAPPPSGCWGVPLSPASHANAQAAAAAASAAVTRVRTGDSARASLGCGEAAAADLLGRLGAAAAARAAATPMASAATRSWPQHYQQQHGFARSPADSGFWHQDSLLDGGTAAPNLKFLHNVLPLLLEETLGELAASCGPDLRTTTLLLNSYMCREGVRVASGTGLNGAIGGHGRWARRAILRHAAATLHVTPEASETASVGTPLVAAGAGPGSQSAVRCLRAVLSKGLSTGEDGGPLRTWSLKTPIRLASAPVDAEDPDHS